MPIEIDHKVKALELANHHAASPAEVTARAAAYHTFLTGGKAAVIVSAKALPPAGKAVTAPAGKPVAAAAAKPGATAAKQPAKAAGGKHTIDEVRTLIRAVSAAEALGKEEAVNILDEDGGGVGNVSNLKAENYDKVYEACVSALTGAGVAVPGAEQEAGDEGDDPNE